VKGLARSAPTWCMRSRFRGSAIRLGAPSTRPARRKLAEVAAVQLLRSAWSPPMLRHSVDGWGRRLIDHGRSSRLRHQQSERVAGLGRTRSRWPFSARQAARWRWCLLLGGWVGTDSRKSVSKKSAAGDRFRDELDGHQAGRPGHGTGASRSFANASAAAESRRLRVPCISTLYAIPKSPAC